MTELGSETASPPERGKRRVRHLGTAAWLQGLAVAAVAVLAHLSFFVSVSPLVWPDTERYEILAQDLPARIAAGLWDLWTTPGYPLLLWAASHVTATGAGVTLTQHALAVAACLLFWRAARRLFGPGLGLAAGLLVALSPTRHYYAQALLSESLAESLLVAGTAALALAPGRSLARLVAWRALAGFCLGLAALTRPNLAAAVVPAVLLPTRAAGAPRAAKALLPGAIATALAWALVVGPWLAFNASRGVWGLAGNAGAHLDVFANVYRVGPQVDTNAIFDGVNYLPADERARVRGAVGRLLGHPIPYLAGAMRVAISLAFAGGPRGDVGPHVPACTALTPERPPPLFSAPPPTGAYSWRCALHGALWRGWVLLVPLGWAGLVAWGVVALRARRLDVALLAAVPLSCLVALALILHGPTRFAFPFEALAVGLGVPAGVRLLVDRVPDGRRLLVILAVAAAARWAAAALTPLAVFPDSIRFHIALRAVLARAPLAAIGDWTAPLAALVWAQLPARLGHFEPAILLHHLLGLLTVALVFLAVRALHGRRVATGLALLFALSPYVLFVERSFLSEEIHLLCVTVATALFVALLRSARPLRWAPWLGFALGAVWLAKSSGALLAAGMLLALLVPGADAPAVRRVRPRLGSAALAAAACLAVVLPWLLHQRAAWGVAAIVPNADRQRLIFALEAGLFEARPELGPNALLVESVPRTFEGGRRVAPAMSIAGSLSDAYGRGAPSEAQARAILDAEIRRKPLAFAALATGTAASLILGRPPEPADELRWLLRSRWSAGKVPEGFPIDDYGGPKGSARAMRLLAAAESLTTPILRAAPLLAILGIAAAMLRGGRNRAWAARLALPTALLIGGHAAALANNFRYLAPYLPLLALGAIAWLDLSAGPDESPKVSTAGREARAVTSPERPAGSMTDRSTSACDAVARTRAVSPANHARRWISRAASPRWSKT